MARRRPTINAPENLIPASIATSLSPASQPAGDTYQDLVDDGSIGTGANQVAAGDHVMSSHGAGEWKLFYSDGDGSVIELALGALDEVLKSGGPSSAPSFGAAGGSGLTHPQVLARGLGA